MLSPLSGLTQSSLRLAFGTVLERVPETAAVRVEIDAEDNGLGQPFVTGALPTLQASTLHDRSLWLPDVGEQVAVLLDADAGVVLGPVFGETDPPPESTDGERVVEFEDGTRVSYSRADSRLRIEAVGDVLVQSAGRVTVESDDVWLGGTDGAEPVPLGRKLRAWMAAVKLFLTTHVHPPNAPSPTPFTGNDDVLSDTVHTT